MTWRINTRATLQGSRHEDSGWIDQDSWKPSDGYEEPADGWGVFAFYVLAGLCVACGVAWAIREVLE